MNLFHAHVLPGGRAFDVTGPNGRKVYSVRSHAYDVATAVHKCLNDRYKPGSRPDDAVVDGIVRSIAASTLGGIIP